MDSPSNKPKKDYGYWSERMKAGRLIEALKQVSPDTEVRCGIGDIPTLLIAVNLFDLEGIPEYEVKSVLTIPDDDKYCTLILKEVKK